jgi:hypothetical protein
MTPVEPGSWDRRARGARSPVRSNVGCHTNAGNGGVGKAGNGSVGKAGEGVGKAGEGVGKAGEGVGPPVASRREPGPRPNTRGDPAAVP